MPKPYLSLCIFLAVAWVAKVSASPEIEFRKPSQEIVRLAENPRLPLYSPDPTRKRFLRLEASGFMPMERLAREEIVLAGFQMFVETRCRSEMIYANNIAVVEILSGKELTIEGIPEDPVIIHAHWSPNGKYVAVLIESDQAVNLWKVDAIRGKATLWSELPVHAGMRQMLDWSGDSQSIWLKTISKSLGERPIRPPVPTGAIVRQTTSQPLPTQTNRGLIKTQFDVEEFEYFFTSQMTRISLDGSHQHVGQPGLFRSFYDSPDQKYLLVERLVQPWSYLVTEEQFAYDLEVWDLESLEVKRVASAPLVEELPYGGGMVRRGARDFEWRSDEPATVVWVEAQDGGNSYNTSRIRDKIFANSAPFTGSPKVLFEMEDRYGDLLWYKEDQAILISWNWIDRDITISSVNPLDPDSTARRLVGFQMGNRYRHPGFPILTFNGQGFPILQTDEAGEHMYLIGEGASLEGDRPFLDRFNLKTKRKKRLFRSKKPYFETPITLMDTEFEEILVVRESKTTPPNYYLWNDKEKFHSQITHVENPVPELANIQRRLLRYKRSDRLNLTANLYLPEGYNAKRDGPLPTLVWAYPRAYQTAENASQLKKSPYQFIKGRWNRPIIWVLRGYAVLDDPAMPIIAEGRNNPNDSFIPQLVDSARAAVRELVRQGVSEKGKIALGGHSYGAFMTANLLAHSDLFCAGIARSGSYNRTLTPFGFQSEERDLWRAPKVYLEMSPFLNAPLINEPLLLFHGMEDRNPGTYPMQSERLFHALNGIGGQARYIQFPNEGHSFRGYDSIMHMLWEIERWLEVHVKGETYPPVNPIAPQPGHGNTVSAAAEISEETADLE